MDHVSELNSLDESSTDGVECSRKVANSGKVAGAIRGLLLMLGVCSLSVKQ